MYRAGVEGAFSAHKPTNIIYNLPNSGYSKGSASGDITQYGLLFNNAIDLEVTQIWKSSAEPASVPYTNIDLHRGSVASQNENGLELPISFLTGLKYNLSGNHNLTG